jgi:hypothetical protein
MELKTKTQSEVENITPHPLNRVTTVSKYLALLLFIFLPFIGAFVGYRFSEENNLTKYVPANVSTIHTDTENQTNDGTSDGRLGNVLYTDDGTNNNLKYIERVQITDEAMSDVFVNNYMNLLVDREDYKIFSKVSTRYGLQHGLYKLSRDSHSGYQNLSEMKTSTYYNEVNGHSFSPDGLKIVVQSSQKTLGYIDLMSDEYHDLHVVDPQSGEVLCKEGMLSCEFDIDWLDNNTFEFHTLKYEEKDEQFSRFSTKTFSI